MACTVLSPLYHLCWVSTSAMVAPYVNRPWRHRREHDTSMGGAAEANLSLGDTRRRLHHRLHDDGDARHPGQFFQEHHRRSALGSRHDLVRGGHEPVDQWLSAAL